MRMLSDHTWQQLQGLALTAHRLVHGLYAGSHASTLRGGGTEFYDYRPYVAGDEAARVDWKLFGRSDRLYVRRFQRYTDLNVMIMLDTSASMGFGGLSPRSIVRQAGAIQTKFALARQITAALGLVVVRQADRVGLTLAGRQWADRQSQWPITGGYGHWMSMCTGLEQAKPTGQTQLAEHLSATMLQMRRRGLVVVVSDMLDPIDKLVDVFGQLRYKGHELMVVQTLSPDELSLNDHTTRRLRLVDPETQRNVAAHIGQVAEAYSRRFAEHQSQVHDAVVGIGGRFDTVTTNQNMGEVMVQLLGRHRA